MVMGVPNFLYQITHLCSLTGKEKDQNIWNEWYTDCFYDVNKDFCELGAFGHFHILYTALNVETDRLSEGQKIKTANHLGICFTFTLSWIFHYKYSFFEF